MTTNMVAALVGPLSRPDLLLGLWVASAFLSFGLILLLMPLLRRYALARPNARSSHRAPTPQGGGIAVVAAAIVPVGAILLLSAPDFKYAWGSWNALRPLMLVLPAVLALAVVGVIDDIRPLPVLPRLVLQLLAVVAVVATSRSFLPLPEWIEAAIVILAGLWFVNLVNFMDGLDWITVAEMAPITGFIALMGWLHGNGHGLAPAIVMAASLCGALVGFAPFNKPVAKLFLGDVGSLPIGLLVGWMLLQVAASGALAAAILLPLYYLMDATITLLGRLLRREKVWQAHRSHFYQKAADGGLSAVAVSGHVFGLNLVLAALAALTILWPTPAVEIVSLSAGVALVCLLLGYFARQRLETAR